MSVINRSLFGYNLRHVVGLIKDLSGVHPGAIHGKRITRAFRLTHHKGGTRKASTTNHERIISRRAAEMGITTLEYITRVGRNF
jgi:hypothetical protein